MSSPPDRTAAMATHPRPVNRMASFLALSLAFAITSAEMPMSLTFFTHKLSWNDARAHCLSINETLVHLDPRANRFMKEIKGYPSYTDVKEHFWIGLFDSDEVNDTTINEQYVWSDTCEPLGAWDAWEGSPGTGSLCVKMDEGLNKGWRTEQCTGPNSFMCAKPLDDCTFSKVAAFTKCGVDTNVPEFTLQSEILSSGLSMSEYASECETICHNNSVSGPPCEFYSLVYLPSSIWGCDTYHFEPSVAPLCDEDASSNFGLIRRLCYEFSVNTSTLPDGNLSSDTPGACLYEPTTESGTEPTTALTTGPTTEPATEPASEPFTESTIELTSTDTTAETLNETTTEMMNGTTFETIYETVNETTNETMGGNSSETTGLNTSPSTTQRDTASTHSPTTTPRPGTAQPSTTTHQTSTTTATPTLTPTPTPTSTTASTTVSTTLTPPTTTKSGDQTPTTTSGNVSLKAATPTGRVNISWPNIRACACLKNTPSDTNGTLDKALQASSAIEKELTLDASSLSSRRRLKESAPDKRPSSAKIGIISVIVLGVIFGVIILWDFFDIYRILRYGIHGGQRQ